MSGFAAWDRVRGRYQRTVGELFFRDSLSMSNAVPHISFTFDDFPRSSLHEGGKILAGFDLRATYYASLGLVGTEAPTGPLFEADDIMELLDKGHELGCHTFDHRHSWGTPTDVFEESIRKNRQALEQITRRVAFRSFSYPISGPRPGSKRIARKYFQCARGGGQTYNRSGADLNLLKAFFLEKSRDKSELIRGAIDGNGRDNGWLIFATHDISESPTRYGCTPADFKSVVRYAVESGARILPVSEALDSIKRRSTFHV